VTRADIKSFLAAMEKVLEGGAGVPA
jgi:hypothetical protein